jgi:hypothetical protein
MRHLELEKRNRTEYVDPTSAPHWHHVKDFITVFCKEIGVISLFRTNGVGKERIVIVVTSFFETWSSQKGLGNESVVIVVSSFSTTFLIRSRTCSEDNAPGNISKEASKLKLSLLDDRFLSGGNDEVFDCDRFDRVQWRRLLAVKFRLKWWRNAYCLHLFILRARRWTKRPKVLPDNRKIGRYMHQIFHSFVVDAHLFDIMDANWYGINHFLPSVGHNYHLSLYSNAPRNDPL